MYLDFVYQPTRPQDKQEGGLIWGAGVTEHFLALLHWSWVPAEKYRAYIVQGAETSSFLLE